MRDDDARPGHRPDAPFGPPPHPRLPVFRAPDGGWYVDRDGLTAATERRWRQACEPRMIRRRARLASLAGLLRAVLLLVGCAALGAGVDIVVGGSSEAVVIGAAIGAVVGVWVALLTMLARQGAAAPGPVVRVPEEVLLTQVTSPSPRRVWLWSTALDAEARARATIGYEVEVERPAQQTSAAKARARYAVTYRAYVEAATDLGLPLRAPAVPLEP
jgi:hypothetical protein